MQIQAKMRFDSESRESIVKYLNVLVSEIDRTLGELEEKKDALYMIDLIIKKEIDLEDIENQELVKKIDSDDKRKKAKKNLEEDILRIKSEFEVIDTLFNSMLEELRGRFS